MSDQNAPELLDAERERIATYVETLWNDRVSERGIAQYETVQRVAAAIRRMPAPAKSTIDPLRKETLMEMAREALDNG